MKSVVHATCPLKKKNKFASGTSGLRPGPGRITPGKTEERMALLDEGRDDTVFKVGEGDAPDK